MQKARILLLLGIWVALLPYFGFPMFWKNILFSASGLVLVYFSFMIYREYKLSHLDEIMADNFSENSGGQSTDESLEIPKV